jgi:hypothetical protein
MAEQGGDSGSGQRDQGSAPLWEAKPISLGAAIGLGIGVGLALVVLTLLLCSLWPKGNLIGDKWIYEPLSGFKLFAFVAVWGAIGGMVHVIMSYGLHFVLRDFSANWIPWYILRPFEAALVGAIAFYALAGGVVGSGENASSLDKTIAISALAGMFSPQVVEKFRQVASTLFSPPAQRQAPSGPPKPVVEPPKKPIALNPDGTATFALSGRNFRPGSTTVRIGAQKVDGKALTIAPTKIDIKLDKATAAGLAGKKHKLAVANPPPAGESDEIDIEFDKPGGSAAAPRLTSVNPKEIKAAANQKLTLTGTNLGSVQKVQVGGAPDAKPGPSSGATKLEITIDASTLPKDTDQAILLDGVESDQKVKIVSA